MKVVKVGMVTGDGRLLVFEADEVLVGVGPDEVQFLSPNSHILQKGNDGLRYDTSVGDLVASGIVPVETNEGVVPLAHPFETMVLYGIRQCATGGKHDKQNTAAVLREFGFNPADPYVVRRTREIGLDDRDWDFIRNADSGLIVPDSKFYQPDSVPEGVMV